MNTPDGADIERRPSKGFDLIGTLRMHWMEIAVFGSVLFALSIPVAYLLSKEHYTVQGRILVAPSVETFIARNEETPVASYYNAYVQTNVERLKHLEIFEKALSRLDPTLKSRFVPKRASLSLAASILQKKVEIAHQPGTHLITITMTDRNPEGIAELVNNVADVYMESMQKEQETKEIRRLMYLKDEKARIEEEIIAQNKLLQEIAREVGSFSFESENNIYEAQLESLQEQYAAAYLERVAKENTLNTLLISAGYKKNVKIKTMVDDYMNQSSNASRLRFSIQEELAKLRSSLDEYLPEHPNRIRIEEKIRALEETLKKLERDERREAERLITDKLAIDLDEKIVGARAEYEAAKRAEDEVRARFDAVLAKRAEVSRKLISGKQISERLEHLRDVLNRIEDRITELTLESKAPGRLQVETYARRPERPSGSNFKKILTLFFMFSYGGFVVICIAYDIMDSRVRGRKHVLDALGAQPFWPISNYAFTGSGHVPFSRVTMDDPSNVVAKAIQSIAIRIDRERKKHGAKCVVFTGVDRQCGTSEIVLNTAYAITKLCKRIIVIESNFEHPHMAELINAPSDRPGIVDFLIRKIPIKECIVHDKVRDMDFILPGRLPSPVELGIMDLSIIPDMITELKELYDLIIVDCSPILASDITEYYVLQSDVAIAVIQGDKTRYEDLYLAGDILFRLKVPAIGAVLNWGAPKNLNRAQVMVAKMLWPLEKFLARITNKNPKYVRYFIEPSHSSAGAANTS